MKSHKIIKVVALFVCLTMSGCGAMEDASIVSTPGPIITDTLIPLSETLEVRGTLDVSPTMMLSSTSPSPTRTSIPTASPTGTLIPTLPPAEEERLALELLRDNGGCRLPCFFGFVPGETSVERILSILRGPSVIITRGDLLLETFLIIGRHDVQPGIVRWIQVDMTASYERWNPATYVYDSPLYAQYFEYYTLPYLLSNYEMPDEVYVSFEYDPDGRSNHYFVFVDYSTSGWNAMFTMPLERQGDTVIGCPSQAFVTLKLWSPGDTEMLEEYGFTESGLKTIEEATSLTLEEFYQQFKDPANAQCMETPLGLYNK